MKTLKGVIAATTYADYQTPLTDSNLFIEPWYFVLSSSPYAVEVGPESIQSHGSDLVSVRMNEPPEIDEEFQTSGAALSEGSLRELRFDYVLEPEEFVSVGMALVSGSLTEPLKSITLDTDSVEARGAAIVAGMLRVGLITQQLDIEEMVTSGAELIGGSLNAP